MGIPGWVPGVYYPATLLEEVPYQRSGPRKACKAWSGWVRGRARYGDGGGVGTHPPGPVGTPAGSLPGTSQNAASQPIRARFDDIS